jgi:hypothetical protein
MKLELYTAVMLIITTFSSLDADVILEEPDLPGDPAADTVVSNWLYTVAHSNAPSGRESDPVRVLLPPPKESQKRVKSVKEQDAALPAGGKAGLSGKLDDFIFRLTVSDWITRTNRLDSATER